MDLGVPPAISEEDGEVCKAQVKGSLDSLDSFNRLC